MKNKKGLIAIQTVVIASLVILFGLLIVSHRATTTDSVLDIYENKMDQESTRIIS